MRICVTGGTEIQEECRRLLEDMGELSEGDVLVSGPGQLRCKSIIHVVIPTNAEDEKVEESMLTIVVKCLETASERGYTSIALPLLTSNTWVFTYTDKLAARATVKAARGFLAMYPDSSIKNVTFCDTRSEAVTEFRAAITDSAVVKQGKDVDSVILSSENEKLPNRKRVNSLFFTTSLLCFVWIFNQVLIFKPRGPWERAEQWTMKRV